MYSAHRDRSSKEVSGFELEPHRKLIGAVRVYIHSHLNLGKQPKTYLHTYILLALGQNLDVILLTTRPFK